MILDFQRHPRRVDASAAGGVGELLARMRAVQSAWSGVPLRRRLHVLTRVRGRLAARASSIASLVHPGTDRTLAETLAAEVLPLADACRFLERRASRILAPRSLGAAGRPLWLAGSRAEIVREPHGVVLIIGPSNYPLLLPGVQALQALAAGNAVLLKPGRGGSAPLRALARIFVEAGLPGELLVLLPESIQRAEEAMDAGVDKVVLTGSVDSGRSVLARLASTPTPATMELSGCDAVFVREDADLDLVVRAVTFGASFCAGKTCIAPRRIFAHASLAAELERKLKRAFQAAPAREIDSRTAPRLIALVENALAHGARLATGAALADKPLSPLLLANATPEMEIMRTEVFAPVVAMCEVDGDDHALRLADRCPYALGATVFGATAGAEELARRVRAGIVVINDMIVPTADPRLPFGGRGASGFGLTRGAEGLLEMTVTKAIVTRRGKRRVHLDPPRGGEERLFDAFVRITHSATWAARFAAARDLMLAGRELSRTRRREKGATS